MGTGLLGSVERPHFGGLVEEGGEILRHRPLPPHACLQFLLIGIGDERHRLRSQPKRETILAHDRLESRNLDDQAGRIVEARYAHPQRSEEHTSELQSLMRSSYAVF